MGNPSKLVIVCSIIVIVVVVTVGFQDMFLNPLKDLSFRSGKEKVMLNLHDPNELNFIKANLTDYYRSRDSFSYEDIHEWVNEYLAFVESFNETKRSNVPSVILTRGIGKCQEFSILFASACLSVGKEVRILYVAKKDFEDFPHAFNEVKLNGSWVQADCSVNHDKLFLNDTSCYRNWFWWPKIGSDYEIIAFDQYGLSETVTYKFCQK